MQNQEQDLIVKIEQVQMHTHEVQVQLPATPSKPTGIHGYIIDVVGGWGGIAPVDDPNFDI